LHGAKITKTKAKPPPPPEEGTDYVLNQSEEVQNVIKAK
jgi:hypothetical protein